MATDVFIDFIHYESQVLDIGGHLGYFSCIAGKLAKNGKVHAFEVDPKCIALMQENLRRNDLDNVEIHNYAISDSVGIVKIPEYNTPFPGLMINPKSLNNFKEVEARNIDHFLEENDFIPDFIKIDIEGAEGKALEGMQDTMKNTSATLLIEIHVDNLKNHFNADYRESIKLLLKYGYTLQELEHRDSAGKNKIIDLNTTLEGNTMILAVK